MVYAFVLVAFIKLLFMTDSPRLVAGLYTAMAGIGAIVAIAAGEVSVPLALLRLALCGTIAFAYFWSLLRMKPWTGTWWAVVIGGALLVAVVG